jgi:hypothetical protein
MGTKLMMDNGTAAPKRTDGAGAHPSVPDRESDRVGAARVVGERRGRPQPQVAAAGRAAQRAQHRVLKLLAWGAAGGKVLCVCVCVCVCVRVRVCARVPLRAHSHVHLCTRALVHGCAGRQAWSFEADASPFVCMSQFIHLAVCRLLCQAPDGSQPHRAAPSTGNRHAPVTQSLFHSHAEPLWLVRAAGGAVLPTDLTRAVGVDDGVEILQRQIYGRLGRVSWRFCRRRRGREGLGEMGARRPMPSRPYERCRGGKPPQVWDALPVSSTTHAPPLRSPGAASCCKPRPSEHHQPPPRRPVHPEPPSPPPAAPPTASARERRRRRLQLLPRQQHRRGPRAAAGGRQQAERLGLGGREGAVLGEVVGQLLVLWGGALLGGRSRRDRERALVTAAMRAAAASELDTRGGPHACRARRRREQSDQWGARKPRTRGSGG